MKKLIVLLLVVLFSTLGAQSANAFGYWACGDEPIRWRTSDDRVTLRTGVISFPSNSPQQFAFASALNAWNIGPANLDFFALNDDGTLVILNGQNEVWFSSDAALVGDAHGIVFKRMTCDGAKIVETDLVFNSQKPWTMSRSKYAHLTYGGYGVSFDAIAVHELGHIVGLLDEPALYTIMYTWAHRHTNGEWTYAYPGENAANGAVFLYGLDESRPQDLGVAHWRILHPDFPGVVRTGIFDHWPVGDRFWTEMMELVGSFTDWRDTQSEPRFIVFNGQTIWPEFTYENNGADPQEISVGYYLSDDDYITRDDQRIGGFRIALTRDLPATTAFSVTLPNNLAEGTDHYLGVIIDENGEVEERFAENPNATYTAIRVGKAYPVSLAFRPAYVDSGQTTIGVVTLNGFAGAGGVIARLRTTDPFVTVPSTVTVPEGSRSGAFFVQTDLILGTGHRAVEIESWRTDLPSRYALGTVNLKRHGDDQPELTFCEANPDFPFCAECQEDPNAFGCGPLSELDQQDEYLTREVLEDPVSFSKRRDPQGFRAY